MADEATDVVLQLTLACDKIRDTSAHEHAAVYGCAQCDTSGKRHVYALPSE